MKLKYYVGFLAIAMVPAPAWANGAAAPEMEAAQQSSFDEDRADILAMAGNYKVRFDMQESTVWQEGYEARDRKISGGNEVVRVIEDTGKKIILQHLLVVDMGDGKDFIVKHWRQDWEYEPAHLLVYSDRHRWTLKAVPEEHRKGKWSQTVYQVDDSPRYAGVGRWESVAGVRRWSSNWTWRPLARRDAVRDPVYDRYYAINRHSPAPDGWIHFQDNTKMGMIDGKLVPIVQEYVLNSYTKFEDYNVQAADDYWSRTKDYWAAVRASWDKAFASNRGVSIEEEAQTGTVISGELLSMGTKIAKGEMKSGPAVQKAQTLIADATKSGAVQTALNQK
ncbi:MAG: DUF6607 family protein [Parasphingorhabdus sp.]|uniref:DUF6607 family protein n=1 Tax=Parasphingorhabdus sp. TaxID=2709688 RepID=UPI0032995984